MVWESYHKHYIATCTIQYLLTASLLHPETKLVQFTLMSLKSTIEGNKLKVTSSLVIKTRSLYNIRRVAFRRDASKEVITLGYSMKSVHK